MTGTLTTQTERLTIRPYQLTDFPSWLAQSSVPSSGQPDVAVFTEDWFEAWIAEQQQRAADDLGYCFGVFRTTDGIHLGTITFSTLARKSLAAATIGFSIDAPFVRQGYADEAVAAALSLASAPLQYERIEVRIPLDDSATVQLVRRLGMQDDGIRTVWFPDNHTWTEQRIFVRLKTEAPPTGTPPFDWTEVSRLRQDKQYAVAKDVVATYIRQAPDDPFVNYQMAWCHDSLGEETAAVPYYVQAITSGLIPPYLQQAYIGLGSTYRALGRYAEAEQTLTAGLVRFPNHPVLQTFYALTLHNLDRASESTELLIRTLLDTTADRDILTYERALRFYAAHLDDTWDS